MRVFRGRPWVAGSLWVGVASVAVPAHAVELLTDGGVTLQWSGQCTEPVAVTSARAARLSMVEMALPQLQQLMDRAGAAVRQRCPDARQMRFDLPRGAALRDLPGSPAQAPALQPGAAAAPVTAAARASGPARLRPTSSLPRLADAGSRTAQCGVLARWLDSTGPQAAAQSGRLMPATAYLDAFRDEQLLAVFGQVYDDDGGAWREKVHQSVVLPCIQPGLAAQSTNAIGLLRRAFEGAPPDPASPEVRRTMALAHVLRGAFVPQPGALSPAAITAHVQQVRLHYQTAHALLDRADQASIDLAGFRALDPTGPEVRGLRLLAAEDRQRLTELLAQRRTALAPSLAEAWLARAQAAPRTLDSAAPLQAELRDLADVQALLTPAARDAWRARAEGVLDAQLAGELQVARERLDRLPGGEPGAQALAEWAADFQRRFAAFGTAPSVQALQQALVEARTRTLAPLLPPWRARLAAMPASSAEVAARRAELAAWFGTEPQLQGPLHAEFKAELDARELAVRRQQDVAEQGRLQAAQQAQAGSGGAGSLQAGGFTPPDGPAGSPLAAVYEGSFGRVGLEPTSLAFRTLVSGYIRGYSQRCRAHLQDPVELMRSVCERESVTTQGIGMYQREVSRTCVSWREVPTGVFAERSLQAATAAQAYQAGTSSMREVMNLVAGPGGRGGNPLAAASQAAAQLKALGDSGEQTAAVNACDSPALKRLRVNLEHYLHGRPAVALHGGTAVGVALLPAAPGEAYRDSDYTRLLDDLVRANAEAWGFNRYLPGTITGAQVLKRDSGGRPTDLQARYRYTGMSGQQHGTVWLELKEGRPHCLYFADARHDCRPPSARVVEAYIEGKYR